jgi:folylpolyglutamate synthase/dihydropteroate synthase
MAQVAPTLRDALRSASQAVVRGDIILVTGSFAIAGEAKRLLREAAAASLREVKPSNPQAAR